MFETEQLYIKRHKRRSHFSKKHAHKRARGPLEKLDAALADHCSMCGDHDRRREHSARLEPAFDPSGRPKTLCRECRIGSAELLHARDIKAREFVRLVARMKTEEEFGEDNAPPSEDWISTLNELIASARNIGGAR